MFHIPSMSEIVSPSFKFFLVMCIIHFRVVGVVVQSPDYRLLLIWSEKSSAVAFCVANVVLSSAAAGFIGF